MKTLTSQMHQKREFQSAIGQKLVPAMTASINEVLALLSAIIAATAIVSLSIWVTELEMNDVLGAGIWGIGFVFLGIAVENREPRAFLQLVTGVALLILAWLQTSVSADYAIASGALVATWVAVSLFKRLR